VDHFVPTAIAEKDLDVAAAVAVVVSVVVAGLDPPTFAAVKVPEAKFSRISSDAP